MQMSMKEGACLLQRILVLNNSGSAIRPRQFLLCFGKLKVVYKKKGKPHHCIYNAVNQS